MQEDCIGSQGTQLGVALQKKQLKFREVKDKRSTQVSHIITTANSSFTKTRQLNVSVSRNPVNLQQWSSTQ